MLPNILLIVSLAAAVTSGSLSDLVDLTKNKQTFANLQFSGKAFYDSENNVLGTLEFSKYHQYQRQPYVANGYFGARVPNLGHGFAYDVLSDADGANKNDISNGWPLFDERFAGAFVSGFYDLQKNSSGTNYPWLDQYGYDSVISSVPQWTHLAVTRNNHTLDPTLQPDRWGLISNYVQNMSLVNGMVTTSYLWDDNLEVEYEISANKKHINSGRVRLTIKNVGASVAEMTIEDSLDSATGKRIVLEKTISNEDTISILFRPEGVSEVFGAISSQLTYSPATTSLGISSDAESRSCHKVSAKLAPNELVTFVKHVAVVTTDLDPQVYCDANTVLDKTYRVLKETDVNSYEVDHNEAWKDSLGSSMSVLFPDSGQITLAARASIYHLNANMREGSSGLTSALGVSGLSSDSYAGQVFWDTDLWMLPGILPFNPQVSESLLNYRVYTHEQARANIESPLRPREGFQGAIYPWTSGRYGNCTATGPCFDYEYHVNAAVALSGFKLYLSGSVGDDYLEKVIYPLVYDAASMFASFVEYDYNLKQYVTSNLTDPDEFANNKDNGAYTNAAISATMKWLSVIASHLGTNISSDFTDILGHVYMPVSHEDSSIVLEYEDMEADIAVKQADVIMITYPMENELISEEQAISNLKYYALKQVSTGPAMTFPIFSIVSSAMLDHGCSGESYLLKSISPYLRGPFAQFSEQSNDNYLTNGGTHPAFPFLTAHGGLLQTLVRGIMGMQFTYAMRKGKIVRHLEFDTTKLSLLPNGAEFHGIHYLNYTVSVVLNNSTLTVSNGGLIKAMNSSEEGITVTFNPKNGVRQSEFIRSNESASFIVADLKMANENSLSECGLSRMTNITNGAIGDVTVQMHDGDNSTHWQSLDQNMTKILVDLLEPKTVRSCFINWGPTLATRVTVLAADENVTVDYPYLNLTLGILSHVSFGNDLHEKYNYANQGILLSQADVFQRIGSVEVNITAPFAPKDTELVTLALTHNTTRLDFDEIKTRFLLIEAEGTHDRAELGPRFYDVNFF